MLHSANMITDQNDLLIKMVSVSFVVMLLFYCFIYIDVLLVKQYKTTAI